jgi:hypothetical protein
LYDCHNVFDAISDLAEISTDAGGTNEYKPSKSVLQSKVGLSVCSIVYAGGSAVVFNYVVQCFFPSCINSLMQCTFS